MGCKCQLLACLIDALGAQGLWVPEEQKRKREEEEGWNGKEKENGACTRMKKITEIQADQLILELTC